MDEVALFKSQQRFMYSVFSKVLTEPSAVDILRKYSDPKEPDFGDAQAIYVNLCNHYKSGALQQVTVHAIKDKLVMLRLNKDWTKMVTSFMTTVAHTINDHKQLMNNKHDDTCYIKKLNKTLSEHRDMS